jgi:prepilin-type N-terminal cleavage/methylation domain-containing protein
MRRKGFTLVELMTVIGIIAILSAILFPVFKSVRGAAHQMSAGSSIRQLGNAVQLYAADADDCMPLAMYLGPEGLHAWFGVQKPDGTFDPSLGMLSSYRGKRPLKDPIHRALDYLGDQSGFGYNWGYLGSDFNLTMNYWGFPNCVNPARYSELARPSSTIAFATSSFLNAPWLKGGDGRTYDFGFIDPPKLWNGTPNMDFRHQGIKVVDAQKREVRSSGNAAVVFADGSMKLRKQDQIKDSMFERHPVDP